MTFPQPVHGFMCSRKYGCQTLTQWQGVPKCKGWSEAEAPASVVPIDWKLRERGLTPPAEAAAAAPAPVDQVELELER